MTIWPYVVLFELVVDAGKLLYDGDTPAIFSASRARFNISPDSSAGRSYSFDKAAAFSPTEPKAAIPQSDPLF